MGDFYTTLKTAIATGDKEMFKSAYELASPAMKKLIDAALDSSLDFMFNPTKIDEMCADHWADSNAGFSYHPDYIANTLRRDFFIPDYVDPRDLGEKTLARKQEYLCRLLSAVPHNSLEMLKTILTDVPSKFSAVMGSEPEETEPIENKPAKKKPVKNKPAKKKSTDQKKPEESGKQ